MNFEYTLIVHQSDLVNILYLYFLLICNNSFSHNINTDITDKNTQK